ncbi:MAG: phage tail tape measure protein, partial [Oscillospiraceae bacterium]|nr:phage tail tape measure protein [Oscillospiraceae bacterium]
MSTVIDEKVVEMRFDNKQFEAGVATSLNTLDRLKKGLDLDGAAKGFDSLSDAARKIDMSSLGSAAEAVSSKFSALETIAVGALLKIGSQAVTTGEQLLKSLTIDQITEGWSKYSDKTTAVQTIMAATGKSIDEVNGSLEKLIWFTDETSYSMTDMTSNIGKFTSQGIELDTAVTAMEGISTWASLSGGSINEASRAMYNLSQALGVGAVKLQDWKSIENANMATKEFKEMAMEAAAATGDLTKSFDAAGNAIYKTSKGTEVTAANFSSTLSDAWFTSDALISVLNNYGSYADGVFELYNNLGDGVNKTTSEIISDLKRLQGADDQTILNAGYTEDQIELVRKLSQEVGGIGQKSFAAAQEAKTFEEVITSVKEAVASGWSQTFETIFGNYEEAKVLWTDLANALYEVFAEGGNARNELLQE